MVSNIHIENYKSIQNLELQARRVNVFIGEPNTGKSNIVEALAFFSPGCPITDKEVFRYNVLADLFYDQKVTVPLSVVAGDWKVSLQFRDGRFEGYFMGAGSKSHHSFNLDHAGEGSNIPLIVSPIRFYAFKPLVKFPKVQPVVLNPPYGDNLVAVLYSNETLRQNIGAIVRSQGFRLQLKPTDNELLITKEVKDELYSYPWRSISETLRRVAFLMAVLETNGQATLLLDEPEANTFPFYTKCLAERMAHDATNQFFITTHNPYLLTSLVEKTPAKDLAVYVTRLDQFETKVSQISEDRLSDLLEYNSDVFFNLDKLLDK
jgi:AAA domain, putative AbiEii toxin, Type IV TA system/AAA ATPase domain